MWITISYNCNLYNIVHRLYSSLKKREIKKNVHSCIHSLIEDLLPEHLPWASTWARCPVGGLRGGRRRLSSGTWASFRLRNNEGKWCRRMGEGEEGGCELACLCAYNALLRKPSVRCLISVLLNSGQGGGPSAKVDTEKTFSLCRKLASEGRLCAQHRTSLQRRC